MTLGIAMIYLCINPVLSNNSADPLEAANSAIASLGQATKLLAMAKSGHERITALTDTIQAYEYGLSALRDSLRQARLRETSVKAALDIKGEKLAKLLGVLQSISRAPEPALLIHPSGPIGTAHAGMILSEVTPALHQQASILRHGLEELHILSTMQEDASEILQDGLTRLQQARFELSLAITRRTEFPRRFVQDPENMDTLVTSSQTLERFASGLMSAPESGNASGSWADFASARGRLSLPVFGTIIRQFNERDAAGIERPGLIIATRPLALVRTPWPATIRYLGPLLNYGNVVVIEPDDGYLLVFAGLGQVYGEVGEVIAKGAPIGLMGGATVDPDQDILINVSEGTGNTRSETLYLEIRHNASPVNPADWFATAKEQNE